MKLSDILNDMYKSGIYEDIEVLLDFDIRVDCGFSHTYPLEVKKVYTDKKIVLLTI